MRLQTLIAILVAACVLPTSTAAAQDAAPASTTSLTGDLGYVATSGNTEVTTMSIGEKLTHGRGRLTLEQSFSLVYGEQQGTVITNNLRTGIRGDYRIVGTFALFAAGVFDRNVFAGIERRFAEQVGVQVRTIGSATDTLRIEGGVSVTQETAVGGAQSNFTAGRAAAAWRHAFTEASYFQQNLEFLPNLSDTDDYRFNTESALVAPISARIGVKLSYVIRYDNLPEPGFSTTDRLFTTGIQLTFD
jgi:putative salt-induced outer membrane protein